MIFELLFDGYIIQKNLFLDCEIDFISVFNLVLGFRLAYLCTLVSISQRSVVRMIRKW